MRKIIFLVIFIAVILVCTSGGVVWFKKSFTPKSNVENYQSFLITKGASAGTIANRLEEEGIIRSALAFKFYTQLTGISQRIQAGEYSVSPHMSIPQIISVLTSAPLELWVTVPEGLRREEIVEKFISGLGKTEDEVSFREEFLAQTTQKEGFLFPDTYLFPKEANASAVVAKMDRTFNLKIEDYQADIEKSGRSLEDIVTLASIIERETKTDTERPIVAGVLLNRLKIGMALQADAATQYAIGSKNCKGKTECDWWVPLTREDLEINSPYNTYKFQGLPPAPIASPGLSSLKAAINPTETDYYYYIHDPSGQIHFAKTLDEHNANVRKYLGK